MGPLKRRAGALAAAACTAALAPGVNAEEPSLEYRVKAAYLYNFAKYVEWPEVTIEPSLTICVAGRNPFGSILAETVRGETIANRDIVVRSIADPDGTCNVIFVPQGTSAGEFLRAARSTPVLTVGETPDFIAQGGIVRFVVDEGKVRFEIDPDTAAKAGLRISSRLLQLARTPSQDRRE